MGNILVGPCSMGQKSNKVELTFNSELEARTFFNSHTVQINRQRITNDAPARYHLERGCCDGTDPVACHKFNERQEAERKERERAERRAASADEYAGTEPTEGDQVFCPRNKLHSILKMGSQCPVCKWVA